MARKNLKRFAALAGLAALANRGGGGGGGGGGAGNAGGNRGGVSERQIAADREASAEPQSMEDDSGMDPMEAANKRVERTLRNPNAREFGEPGTSMTVTPTAKPVVRKPVARTRPMNAAEQSAFQEANASPRSFSSDPSGYGMNKMARKSPYYNDEMQGGVHGGYASGGKVSSASKRADGCATKGKTRGKYI
jgi:hypothetical protein